MFSLPPDPLHNNLLGAGNDACECLEKHFPAEMMTFYAYNHLKKSGQGPGGKFNGPSIKHILREDILSQLENLLPVNASSFISYLRSLRNLHELCVAENLGDYETILFDFKTNFDFLYEEFKLPMTLRIHLIIDHYSDYFQWTNQTMRLTNAEFTETAHSTFKMSERIHKFKISRKIGTPVHQEMALKSLVWHNSKRAGFVSPLDFKLRKSSPRVWGSPLSSPRLK